MTVAAVNPHDVRCEVCRRYGAGPEYSPDGTPRGQTCTPCALAIRQVESRIVLARRVLGYLKKYAPRPRPAVVSDGG